jgi:CelD/BcsL family acetyltransferase involved in cellulose biosynthesis
MRSILKVVEFNEFQSLKDRWNESLSESLDNNIFSTWEWLSIWWKHFGEEKKLVILLVEDKNEILAIAPFVLSRCSLFGFGGLKKISFVGSPDSDYNSFILKERNIKLLESILDYLNNHIEWDYLELEDISEISASMDLLRRIPLKKPYKHWEERQSTLCPFLTLPNSMDVFMKGLSKNMRQNLRRYSRKLEGEYRVEFKNYDEIGSVEEAMETFFQLHQKRWESRGDLGAFNKPLVRNFHIDIAKCFAEKGWLRLYFLTVNDKPISTYYSFEYNQKVYYYLGGWDPEYSRYMIGSLFMMYDIGKCIQRGLKEYDLMRGIEPYKTRWTTKARKNITVSFVRKGLFPQIYSWLIKRDKIHKAYALLLSRVPALGEN